MSKEVLLGVIGDKAKEQAEEIVASAQSAAAAAIAKAEAELSAEYDRRIAEINEQTEQALAGQKTLLRIDGKKYELGAKREIIDEVYRSVENKIVTLSDAEYVEFVSGLITKNAEDGDKVIICKRDEKRLTADWLADLANDMQISLEFAKERHGDKGGVILRGAKYDKNLTVSAIMDEVKKSTESHVVRRLFG